MVWLVLSINPTKVPIKECYSEKNTLNTMLQIRQVFGHLFIRCNKKFGYNTLVVHVVKPMQLI